MMIKMTPFEILRMSPKPIIAQLAIATIAIALAQFSTAQRATKAQKQNADKAATAPVRFAPLPEGHDLASIWNDPDFTRRLLGSYGFESDVEPRSTTRASSPVSGRASGGAAPVVPGATVVPSGAIY